jgi:hypothetical protein
MDGIYVSILGNNIIIEIHDLTDELKKKIKDELVEICQGEYALTSISSHCSFPKTIEELVDHRLPKDKNKKKGAVAELLLNVIIRIYTDMRIISPFFNMEERNVKKGFDIIAIDEKNDMWFIESKAGEAKAPESVTDKLVERINTAKRDLDKRLNDDNSQLWLNAIKSVRSSLDDNSEKATIVNILEENSNSPTSSNKNVVLGGTVFCIYDSCIQQDKIKKLYNKLNDENTFLNLQIIAIRKKTYEKIYEYLLSLKESK